MSPGMIHCPVASITSTCVRSSSSMPAGSRPMLRMRWSSITSASLGVGGRPEPSINVPLRMTSVFIAFAPSAAPAYKGRCELFERAHSTLLHGDVQLGPEDLQDPLDAGLSERAEPPQIRPPDGHAFGPQRQGFDDVRPAAKSTVD